MWLCGSQTLFPKNSLREQEVYYLLAVTRKERWRATLCPTRRRQDAGCYYCSLLPCMAAETATKGVVSSPKNFFSNREAVRIARSFARSGQFSVELVGQGFREKTTATWNNTRATRQRSAAEARRSYNALEQQRGRGSIQASYEKQATRLARGSEERDYSKENTFATTVA